MIKDRAQKALALRYAVGKRWFPQLELEVFPRTATGDSQKAITDIDLLASIPDEFDGYREVVIDCKSGKRESPIARALWVRGLMDHVSATRGLCILDKERIENDHRYSAACLSVTLVASDEFSKYAAATGSRMDANDSNVGSIELWERFLEIKTRRFVLAGTIEFSTAEYWSCDTPAEGCRKVIGEAMRIKPELDPAKQDHMAVVFDLCSLFAHSLAKIVARLFASYLQPANRDDLSKALLNLLYGGHENYEHLNSLKNMILPNASNAKPLTLPDWERLLQLVRQALDSPTELPYAALILREVGWGFLRTDANQKFAAVLCAEKRQAAKLALLATNYLTKATKLPDEFVTASEQLLLELQQPPA